jgi:hypothetical protein
VSGSASAADAVHIRFKIILCRTEVEVNDVRHLLNVEASSRDVGGDQHPHASLLKVRECSLALRLRTVSVDLGRLNSGSSVSG